MGNGRRLNWDSPATNALPITMRLSEPPTPPGRLVAEVPPELDRIVLGLLEKEPAKRYATADALLPTRDKPKPTKLVAPFVIDRTLSKKPSDFKPS